MTHDQLVQRAVRWLRATRGCGVVYAELVCANPAGIIPDAIGWRAAGWSILVECKVSRSDFLADRKKVIHLSPDHCPGQERWYLTPPGLVRVDELPAGWHLAEAHATTVRTFTPLRGGTIDGGVFNRDRQVAELPFLLSAARRHALGVEFYPARGRFKTLAAQAAELGRP